MKNVQKIALLLLSLSLMLNVYSQENVSIHFGPSIPILDFASDNIDDEAAGGAALGVNIGLQYQYPITEGGLGVFGGVDLNYNGLKKSVKDEIEEIYERMGLPYYNITYYKYINVPIILGLSFSDEDGLFLNAGLVCNLLKITDMKLLNLTTEMDLSYNIGFKVGIGVLIKQKVSISMNYFGLGTHYISGKAKTYNTTEDINLKGKIDLLNFTLGIKL